MTKKKRKIFTDFVSFKRFQRELGRFDVYAETEYDTGEGGLPEDGKRSVDLDVNCNTVDLDATDCPELLWIHKFMNRKGDLEVDLERNVEFVTKRRAFMGTHKGKMGRKLRLTKHRKYADGLSARRETIEYFNGKKIRHEK